MFSSGDDGEVAAAAQGRYSLLPREADGENVHHLTVGLTPVASATTKASAEALIMISRPISIKADCDG